MTLVFDFDGTLHDTAHVYANAVREVYPSLVEEGIAPARELTDDELSRFLGVTAQEMWRTILACDIDAERLQEVISSVGVLMRAQIERGESRLYPGIAELLTDLKQRGHTLVLLSNCTEAYMASQKKAWKLDGWFSAYYCSETYGNIPKEEFFLSVMRDFPGKYLVIGDREKDFRVGLVHGVPTIACCYGYGNESEWQLADYRAHSVDELASIIAGF